MSTLRKIIRNDSSLSIEEYRKHLENTFNSSGSNVEAIALLSALSSKQLRLLDILSLVEFIEHDAPKTQLNLSERAINIVGTGGGISTFNISTTATLVAASAGTTILKSGSYSYNSVCGSLDLLKRLGIKLSPDVKHLEMMLQEMRLGFVSPQLYPPILKRIAISALPFQLRDIGGVINTIGPLLCPFVVQGQICGVSRKDSIELFARAMSKRQLHNSIAVWSDIGIDEFSACGKNYYSYSENSSNIQILEPANFGMSYFEHKELSGDSVEDNIRIMESVLKDGMPGVAKDTVALNAAFAVKLAHPSIDLQDAIALCVEKIESGESLKLLNAMIAFSNKY